MCARKVLIIGQGIAGSILAHTFRKQKIDFTVVDVASLSASSRIAAGIWNPIVFKRMTQSWMANETIPVMHHFFLEAETFLRKKILRKKCMLKFFTEKQEADLWQKKIPELQHFVDEKIYAADNFPWEEIHPPEYGYSFVTESGAVDSEEFIRTTREWLKQENRLTEKQFHFYPEQIKQGNYWFDDCAYENVIFCEGWRLVQNILFEKVIFKPAKGELLHFHCEELSLDIILNKGIFILPKGNNQFICGATYDWSEQNDEVTEKKQEQLEQQLKKILRVPFTVINRYAGVRPSVIDRRPVIGQHPNFSCVHVFNGFGTKAILLAPYFAEHLSRHLFENETLMNEIRLERFFN